MRLQQNGNYNNFTYIPKRTILYLLLGAASMIKGRSYG